MIYTVSLSTLMHEVTSPSSKNLQEILARISEDLNRNITPDEIDQLHQKFDIIERFAGLRSGHDVDHDSGGGVGHHIHHHSLSTLALKDISVREAQECS